MIRCNIGVYNKGINGSIEADAPFKEHFFGLVNFGNTCYVNSVLQALYFCKPFREKIIHYKLGYNQRIAHLSNSKDTVILSSNNYHHHANSLNNDSNDSTNHLNTSNSNLNNSSSTSYTNNNLSKDKNLLNGANSTPTTTTNMSSSSSLSSSSNTSNCILKQEHLLNCLAELFYSIVTMKKKKGIVQPKKFIARLRKDNDAFDNLFQQDAHEFLNYLLNTCADILKAEMKELNELKKLQEIHNQKNENNYPPIITNKINSKTHKLLNNNNSKTTNQQNGALTLQQQQNSSSSNNNNNNNPSTPSNKKRNNSTNGSTRSVSSQNSINSKAQSSDLDDLTKIYLLNKEDPSGLNKKLNNNINTHEEDLTWIHELFQGTLVNETKCLNCETSSSKEENFFDLSIDIEQNTSLSHCLQEFSNMEMLCGECKYYCETCCSKQEAEKRMRIKKLPKILALHLKRFKFESSLNKFVKLTYRVVFPFELRLFNTTEDCTNGDRIYDLVSFVVHCGMGLNRGHYISVVKSNGWFLFDDEKVEKIEESSFEVFYGLTQDTNKKSETSYILFYETRQS